MFHSSVFKTSPQIDTVKVKEKKSQMQLHRLLIIIDWNRSPLIAKRNQRQRVLYCRQRCGNCVIADNEANDTGLTLHINLISLVITSIYVRFILDLYTNN